MGLLDRERGSSFVEASGGPLRYVDETLKFTKTAPIVKSFKARGPAPGTVGEQDRRNGRFWLVLECVGVDWRATADEDGHYCFAVAL
jgi:hypothetical protein